MKEGECDFKTFPDCSLLSENYNKQDTNGAFFFSTEACSVEGAVQSRWVSSTAAQLVHVIGATYPR
jgi:hypothetical protein